MTKLNFELAAGDVDFLSHGGILVSEVVTTKVTYGSFDSYIAIKVRNFSNVVDTHKTIVTVHQLHPDWYESYCYSWVLDICSFADISDWDKLPDAQKIAAILEYDDNYERQREYCLIGDTAWYEGDEYYDLYEQEFEKILARINNWYNS